MIPGKRYEIADMISLLLTTEYEITPEGKTPYKDQKTPRWHRWVRNAVRESPDRTNHNGNGWPELRAEHVGPSISDWEYWIEKEGNISVIEEDPPQPTVPMVKRVGRMDASFERILGLNHSSEDIKTLPEELVERISRFMEEPDGETQEEIDNQLIEMFELLEEAEDVLSTTALKRKIKQLEKLTESAAPRRPVQNDGWLAEQRVIEYLEKEGWKCFDVSREAVGFDILARASDGDIFVEVKSSTSLLKSISLTENEWRAALLTRDKYWIAYFDHFDSEVHEPTGWIKDPARITPTERKTTEFSLPRNKWPQ
jgi:Holliday junction resolvase-like predicted endonuclease